MADESHPALGDNEEPADVVSPVKEGLAARERGRPWLYDSPEEGPKRRLISYRCSVSTHRLSMLGERLLVLDAQQHQSFFPPQVFENGA